MVIFKILINTQVIVMPNVGSFTPTNSSKTKLFISTRPGPIFLLDWQRALDSNCGVFIKFTNQCKSC